MSTPHHAEMRSRIGIFTTAGLGLDQKRFYRKKFRQSGILLLHNLIILLNKENIKFYLRARCSTSSLKPGEIQSTSLRDTDSSSEFSRSGRSSSSSIPSPSPPHPHSTHSPATGYLFEGFRNRDAEGQQ